MRKFFIIFLLIILGTIWAKAQVSFHAIPQKNQVGINEPVRIQFLLSIKNEEIKNLGRIKLPSFSNTQVIGRQVIQNQSYDSEGNNVIEYGVEVILRAVKKGSIRIDAAQVSVNYKKYETKPLIITVSGEPNSPEEDTAFNSKMGEFFLKLKVSEKSPYQNEGIVTNLKFYTRRIELLNSMTNLTMPDCQGVFVQHVKERNNVVEQEIINGDIYFSKVIGSYIMFPTQSGTIIINPFILTLTIPDGFFNEHDLNIKSAPVSLQVKKLPEDSPENFYGLVGQFYMQASANKKELQTEEAVTVNVEINGKGNISLLKSPNLNVSEDIEKYTPKSKLESENTSDGIRGKLNTSTILVPQKVGKYNVNVETISYFDPKEQKYKQLSVEPILINVLSNSLIKNDEDSYNVSSKDSDSGIAIHHEPKFTIRKKVEEAFKMKNNSVETVLILLPLVLIFVIIIGLTIILFIYIKKNKSKKEESKKILNPTLTKENKFTSSRKPYINSVSNDYKSELSELNHLAQEGTDKKEFYILLEKILIEVAQQRLHNEKESYVTSVDLEEELADKLGDELSEEWKNLLLKSQIERYSSVTEQESLLSVYSKTKDLIKKINTDLNLKNF